MTWERPTFELSADEKRHGTGAFQTFDQKGGMGGEGGWKKGVPPRVWRVKLVLKGTSPSGRRRIGKNKVSTSHRGGGRIEAGSAEKPTKPGPVPR